MGKASKTLMAVAVAASAGTGAAGISAAEFSDLVTQGKANVNLRYRFENVDQENISADANASTLRSRLTWTSGTFSGISGVLEVDNISAIGNDNYNSTENGKTHYPVVADPEGTEVNQAFLGVAIAGAGTLDAGRMRINHANQRFLGGVGWRQNEQTYDALRFQSLAINNVTLDYAYIWNVNRVFGPRDGAQKANWDGDVHALRAGWTINPDNRLGAFLYALDIDDARALSSTTVGVDYAGAIAVTEGVKLALNLAYARQSDGGDNPNHYDADYLLAEATLPLAKVALTAGYEVLGSDNNVGFSTPLATLHAFQGFADQFLATPGAGVEDSYLRAAGALAGVKLAATYHDFSADRGSGDYGSELDLSAAYGLLPNLNLLVKYAAYNGDSGAPAPQRNDVDKFWIMLEYSL